MINKIECINKIKKNIENQVRSIETYQIALSAGRRIF